jgi:hypothetical protein
MSSEFEPLGLLSSRTVRTALIIFKVNGFSVSTIRHDCFLSCGLLEGKNTGKWVESAAHPWNDVQRLNEIWGVGVRSMRRVEVKSPF